MLSSSSSTVPTSAAFTCSWQTAANINIKLKAFCSSRVQLNYRTAGTGTLDLNLCVEDKRMQAQAAIISLKHAGNGIVLLQPQDKIKRYYTVWPRHCVHKCLNSSSGGSSTSTSPQLHGTLYTSALFRCDSGMLWML